MDITEAVQCIMGNIRPLKCPRTLSALVYNGGRMFWCQGQCLLISLWSGFHVLLLFLLTSVYDMSSIALWVKPDAFDFGAIHAPLPPKLTLQVTTRIFCISSSDFRQLIKSFQLKNLKIQFLIIIQLYLFCLAVFLIYFIHFIFRILASIIKSHTTY